MDHMIIRDLLRNTIQAAAVLKKDAALRRQWEGILKELSPTRTGPDGRILEWTEPFEEPEPGHRHISHLYGLHPGREISRHKDTSLLTAARRTLDYRLAHGGGHTGWSRAWIINFLARLGDGDGAHANLVQLLQKSTLPNLFDNHPPFQIDGNFGATAGITEMLLQSDEGYIELLPALPAAWPNGSVKGLVARGGYEIDLEWKEGKLTACTVTSRLGGTTELRYGKRRERMEFRKGERREWKF
jgi:alpha-L-fucosidase 2